MKRGVIISILLHLGLVSLLFIGFLEYFKSSDSSNPEAEIIEAYSVDARTLKDNNPKEEPKIPVKDTKQIDKMQAEQQRKEKMEIQKQKKLEQKKKLQAEISLQEKRKKRLEQEIKLKELELKKKKQQEDLRKKQQEQKRKKEYEAKKQEKLKQEQEAKEQEKLKKEQEAKEQEKLKKEQEAKEQEKLKNEQEAKEQEKLKNEQEAKEQEKLKNEQEAKKAKLAEQERLAAARHKKELAAKQARDRALTNSIIDKYSALIKQKMEKNWRLPADTRNLVCTTKIKLLPDGSVFDVKIIKSSGSRSFDGSVVDALYNAGTFPLPNKPKYRALFVDDDLTMKFTNKR